MRVLIANVREDFVEYLLHVIVLLPPLVVLEASLVGLRGPHVQIVLYSFWRLRIIVEVLAAF